MYTEKIKRLREEKNMTVAELAELSKVNTSTTSKFCYGLVKTPLLTTAKSISDVLNVSLDYLFDDNIPAGKFFEYFFSCDFKNKIIKAIGEDKLADMDDEKIELISNITADMIRVLAKADNDTLKALKLLES